MEPGTADGVRIEVEGSVGRIEFTRPGRLNALTLASLRRVASAAQFFNSQAKVRAVVVTGAGGAFTAGMDVTEFEGLDDPEVIRAGARLGTQAVDGVEDIDAVTVAVIEGHCVGGGVLIAAACDLRVAAEEARFAIPEIRIGLPFTWGGVPRLVRELGPSAARDLILTGRSFGADEALRLGLAHRVVTADNLEDELTSILAGLEATSRNSLLANKRALREAARSSVRRVDDSKRLSDAFADGESQVVMQSYLDALGSRRAASAVEPDPE